MKGKWMGWMLAAGLLAAGAAAQAAEYEATVKVVSDPHYGEILTDAKGMVMYLYTKDQPNVSNCSGGCLKAWPALTVEDAEDLVAPDGLPGKLGVIKRSDNGALQVTYNGWPLYGWVKDQKPGDTTGQNVGHVWYVVNPEPLVAAQKDTAKGDVLAGPTGLTLYTYDKDQMGVSNCYDKCAINWPPLLIGYGSPQAGTGADQGDLGTIKRTDGTTQVTYHGMPLYYWIRDKKPGDVTGDGVGGVWHIIKAESSSSY